VTSRNLKRFDSFGRKTQETQRGSEWNAVSRLVRISLVCPLMLSLSPMSQCQTATTNEAHSANNEAYAAKVTVLTYNYARVPVYVLVKAEQEATNIFRKLGVGVLWVDCSQASADVSTNPTCGKPADATTLTLNIHLRFKSSGGMILADHDIGYAVPGGNRAGVAYSCVEHLADSSADRPQILGHVMAHEIGHLLLESAEHSDSGIMRAVWRASDLKAAGHGDLLFAPPESEHIRANAVTRGMQHKADPMPSAVSVMQRGVVEKHYQLRPQFSL
jgi:hypothetical protein